MVKILEVIPIARSAFALTQLSYFSTKKLSRGDLVTINLRGKEIFAIVQKISELKEEKAALKKNSAFKLKPINSLIKEKFLSEEWFRISSELSRDLLIPRPVLLSSLFPRALFSKQIEIQEYTGRMLNHQKLALKGSGEERMQYFRGMIREHFARKKSLLIMAPKIESLKKLEEGLGRGIEEYVFLFSSELSSKKYLSLFSEAMSEEHPILILNTHQGLTFDRLDLETIVIDEEGSRLWREREGTPYDLRQAAEIIAQMKGLRLVLADQILRIETIYRAEKGVVEAPAPLTGRIQSMIETRIIESNEKTENFSWITKELAREIEEGLFKNEKILLFVNRKGYSSFTICQDCGGVELCSSCSTPLVLHGKDAEERKFLCHHCLRATKVPDVCAYCGSWKLKDFGLGIEKVSEEFRKLFPKAEKVVIATEKIFSQSEENFDLVAIVSLDYLFTIPDFRINEAIFRLISELKSKARRKLILQTRIGRSQLLANAISGNLSGFYQDEIQSREKFFYPPFVKVIKLTLEDKNYSRLKEKEQKASTLLKNWNPISFPAFHEKLKGFWRWNIILKIPPAPPAGGWPDENLASLLENLSPAWHIVVDPDSII